jgi:hypothetical protein
MQWQRRNIVIGAKVVEKNAVSVRRVTVGMDKVNQLLAHGVLRQCVSKRKEAFYASTENDCNGQAWRSCAGRSLRKARQHHPMHSPNPIPEQS